MKNDKSAFTALYIVRKLNKILRYLKIIGKLYVLNLKFKIIILDKLITMSEGLFPSKQSKLRF